MSGYVMRLKDGTRYDLSEDGRVLARSDGPSGWNYSGDWIILGFATRWNSHGLVGLEAAAVGADVGQGWVHGLDHGTRRIWAMPRGRRRASIRPV